MHVGRALGSGLWKRGLRRVTPLAGMGLIAALLPMSGAGAALPSVYVLGAGGQGMSFLFNFSGSTVSPLLNAAVPYAVASLSSDTSPAGMATIAYPGTLGLIYQDAIPVAFTSFPRETWPAGEQLGYVAPKYPVLARVDGGERSSSVGAPELSNTNGAMRVGSGRQSCRVADDLSSVRCSAYAANLVMPVLDQLQPPGQPSAQAAPRMAAYRAWRAALLESLAPILPVALRGQSEGDDRAFVTVTSAKTTTSIDVSAEPATSATTIEMQGVELFGGALRFDGLVQHFVARSDGGKGTSEATTTITGAVLGGVPVTIGADGVRLSDHQAVEPDELAKANEQLRSALEQAGLVLRAAQQRDASSGAQGSVEGDGFVFQANVANGPTVYTIQGWLGSGRAQAMRTADSRIDGGSTGASGEPGSGPIEEGTNPSSESVGTGGSDPALRASGESPDITSGPNLSTGYPGGLNEGSSTRSPAGGEMVTVSGPIGGASGDAVPPVTAALAAPAASQRIVGKGRPIDRTTVLALVGIWQMFGLAALGAWGLKVTHIR